MHEHNHGLIIPSEYYLQTEKGSLNNYNHNQDKVAKILKEMGVSPHTNLYGNLPFGYGFSSSSIISYLNLINKLPLNELEKAVTKIDRIIHGFEPSGLDFTFCNKQEPGLFKKNSWKPVILNDDYSFSTIILPKESPIKDLSTVKSIVTRNNKELSKLCEKLNDDIINTNRINFERLFQYSKVLLDLNVYSVSAKKLISSLLKKGIIAKGIGGLYNKAILLMWRKSF